MEEFNFDVPINATVIFDDSDDETNPDIKENIIEEGNKTTPETETFINSSKAKQQNLEATTCEVAEHDASKTDSLKHNKSKQSSLDMPSLEDFITLQGIICNYNERDNVIESDTQSKTDNQKQKKRKLSSSKRINNKRRKSSNVNTNIAEIQEYNSEETQINQNANLNCNPAVLVTETSLPISQKQNIETENHYTVSINSQILNQENNQQKPNTEMSLSQSLKIIDPTLSIYIKELLNTVSEHMVYIMNSYHSYMKIYKNNLNPSLIDHAKNHFIRTRTNFFYLSYTSILNIIIPRENDATFVKNFIDNTVYIARSKSYNFSCKDMESLYYEMINWVKTRQIQMMNLNKTHHSELYRRLQRPPIVIPPPPYQALRTHKPSSRPNENLSNNNLYASPEQNLNIELTHMIKQNGQPCCPAALSQNTQVGYENQILNTQPMQNTSDRLNYYPESLQTSAYKTPQQNIKEYLKVQMYNTQSKPIPPYRPNDSLQHLQNSVQNINLQYNDFRKDAPWQCQATQPVQKQVTQSLPNQTLRAQSLPGTLHELDLSPNKQVFIPEITTQEEATRSSISRDSGFTSPLNFNTSAELTSNLQEEQRLQPLITHVTSLNPNVSYITEGFCSVCGKTTKKKCLGCYKCYYCSHDCQYYDWKNHMAICK